MSSIKGLLQKNKKNEAKREDKKATDSKPNKKLQDDEEGEITALVDIQQTKQTKPKVAKIQVKQAEEQEIDFEALKPKEGPVPPKRISWVPQQGGVQKTFNLQTQKEHFVAIGEKYTPPPEHKPGVSNFKPLVYSEQENKMRQLDATTTPSSEARPKFQNSNTGMTFAPLQKTAQQLKEEEMEAKLAGLSGTAVSKKKKEEDAAQKTEQPAIIIQQRKPLFVNSAKEPVLKTVPLEKTPQQLKEEEMEAKLAGLSATPVSKAEKEAERKRKQEEAAKLAASIPVTITGDSRPVFKNSGVQGTFKALQKTPQQLKEEQLERKMAETGLKAQPLTKEEREKRRVQAQEKEERRKLREQEEERKKQLEAQVPEDAKRVTFTNSKKTTDAPTFVELKETPKP